MSSLFKSWLYLSGIFLLSTSFTHCGGTGDSPPASSLAQNGEALSGGATTVFNTNATAFSQFAPNLSLAQQSDFGIGNSFFEQAWVTAPATTTARDGLGPLFNAISCSTCHAKDGRGSPQQVDENGTPIALLFRLSLPETEAGAAPIPEPHYGDQLQIQAILGLDAEAKVKIDYQEIPGQYADGEAYSLRAPSYEFYDLKYGELAEDLLISPRISAQMIGMGLIEAIAEPDILAQADPDDQDGDGISGRPNYVWDIAAQDMELGRFGWKANQPSVAQQVAGAFSGDIGLSSPLIDHDNCMPEQIDCLNAVSGGSPEVQLDIFDKVVFYSKTLAVPARRDWEEPEVLDGKKVFADFGCTRCHHSEFKTSSSYPLAPLAGQTIRPYSDFLLHDMGEGLADGRTDFGASGSEWRTPPLWGLGLIFKVNGHQDLLHDGRARGVAEAILWHGGEAQEAKEKFRSAAKGERTALLRFLNSL